MTEQSGRLDLRVMVTDVWEMVDITTDGATTVSEVKRAALERAMQREFRDVDYEVKHAGALVTDESATLADLGIRSRAPMIVLPRQRRPVR